MAERRMFAKTIIDSDAFLDMPMSARLLYYDLSMRADDDGFVNSPKKIMRISGASNDDMNILIMRKFIILFDKGIVVIKHWRIHNYIRKDTYNKTNYREELASLELDDNKAYRLKNDCRQLPVDEPSTQVRLGKVSIGKDRLGEVIEGQCPDKCPTETKELKKEEVEEVVKAWNSLSDLGISKISKLRSTTERYKSMRERIKEYSLDDFLEAIDLIKKSDFLQGKNKKKWFISFDWFVKPNNFPKVLEGNYTNREVKEEPKKEVNDVELTDEIRAALEEQMF